MTVNLEAEFGDLLEIIVRRLNNPEDDAIEHFGVKGMKWGVRKDKTSKSSGYELKQLGPAKVTRKTANGEEVTLIRQSPTALHKGIAKVSKKYREWYGKGANLTIHDGNGKKIGDASVTKIDADELNLMWIQIDKSARGRGYATTVMKAAEEFGRQEGFKKLTLEVPAISPDARHIYTKMGFKVTGEIEAPDTNIDIWGGLTEMEYVFDTVKHEGVMMTDLLSGMMSEEEFLAHMDSLSDDELQHYGVKGMKWGKRNPRNASYLDNQVKRDRQVYGTRGVRRINKSLNDGSSISVARGDEKTRRDSVMGRNKYVRQAGKVVGAGVAGAAGLVGTSMAGRVAQSAAGQKVLRQILGSNSQVVSAALSNPIVIGAATIGAAKIGEMFSGDIAVGANMRLHGYDPRRK